jgi:cell wall assembly regulator SMI1
MNLQDRLETFLAQMQSLRATRMDWTLNPPASLQVVEEVEAELGYPLPVEIKEALLAISGHIDFGWFLPKGFSLPPTLRGIFCGDLHWDIAGIAKLNQDKDGWITNVFPNVEDPYDKVWHNKFVFQEVGNGDYLSIDRNPDKYEKVVYLSHDDGEGHGYVMAPSFSVLLEKWSALGCPGAEDWQWLPFCADAISGIDPDCSNALLWKKTIGIN